MIDAGSHGEVLLRVNGLTVRLHSGNGLVHAVEDVSFSLARGQTLGVVGESGSGKSVMARSLMGLLPKRALAGGSGEILFQTAGGAQRDLASLPEKQLRLLRGPALAMVFQDPMTALNPVLRLSVQLTEPLRLHLGLDRQQARSRAIELLASVGIPDAAGRIDQFPHQLSGGMRQRVVIAIALACSPSLLIADEPTTALDVTVQKQILDLLARLQRELHMAMILITHDLGVVASRADHIAVMYAGRVVEYAPANTLFTSMKHPYTEALFNSIPRINDPSHTRLQAIPGRPPQLIDPAPGCAFAPRCQYAQPRCREQTPPVVTVADAPDHQHACFFPVSTIPGGRPHGR
ncbi:MAG: ABC transporter ATP-binding protein [Pseudohongiella sp.]|uniref:ABC transporter ATP-binding protein n=1 Tax=Pseudohongiella sp. TaxID=1979412 RepID=UPI0034A04B0C